MAIIKFIGPIHPHKGSGGKYEGLGNAIAYILDKNKTKAGEREYAGSQHCFLDTALTDMIETNIQYGKEPRKLSDRVGYHFSISWRPEEEVTPEQALSITEKFCQEYLSGHEAVYSVHLDKEHLHSHIVFNSVNAMTGYKYRYVNNDWERKVQPLIDKLCVAEGLHALEEDTGIPLQEYKEERKKKRPKKNKKETTGGKNDYQSHSNNKYYKENSDVYSNKASIRFDIDQAIAEAEDLSAFRKIMEEKFGYRVRVGNSKKYGTYTAFWTEGMDRWRRNYVLGENYTDQAIEQRIALKSEPLPNYQAQEEGAIFLFPGSIYRVRIRNRPQNPFLKKKYAQLYRMGIVPKCAPRISYREKKKQLEKIRQLEAELELLAEINLSKPENVAEGLEAEKEKKADVEKNIRNLKNESRFYRSMLIQYRSFEKMKRQIIAGEREDNDVDFLHLKKVCDTLPFSHEELKDWEKSYKNKMQKFKKQQKRQQSRVEILEKVQEEYLHENFVEEELEEEKLKHMDAQYVQETDVSRRNIKNLERRLYR